MPGLVPGILYVVTARSPLRPNLFGSVQYRSRTEGDRDKQRDSCFTERKPTNFRALPHETDRPDDRAQPLERQTGASDLQVEPIVGSLGEGRKHGDEQTPAIARILFAADIAQRFHVLEMT